MRVSTFSELVAEICITMPQWSDDIIPMDVERSHSDFVLPVPSHEPGRLIATPLTVPLPAKRRGEGARTVVPSPPPTRWRFGRLRREPRLAVPSPRLFAGRGRVRGVG